MSADRVNVLAVLARASVSADAVDRQEIERAYLVVQSVIAALRECVEAEQPMAHMHAAERGRKALARLVTPA